MSKSRKKRRSPKRVLALPDLEQAKSAVLNSLTSRSGQQTYDLAIDDFVDWYCSEPRLAFNRTVVLRYRIHLEQKQYASATLILRRPLCIEDHKWLVLVEKGIVWNDRDRVLPAPNHDEGVRQRFVLCTRRTRLYPARRRSGAMISSLTASSLKVGSSSAEKSKPANMI